MLTTRYHSLDDHGVTRRRVILGLGAAFVIAAVVGMTQTEDSWRMQWQVGTTWVRDARVRQDAAIVSTAAAEESARQAQLVSDFREQLASGEAEKSRVMQKLEAAGAALAAVQNSTHPDEGALRAAKQSAKQAQAEASQLQKELRQAKDKEAEAAKLRKSLAKAQEKLAAVNAELASAKKSAPGSAAKPKDREYYRRFIMQDLAPWKDHGITKDLVDELASPKYEQCYYSNITLEHSGFRFQIINGTLFVDHLPWRLHWGGVVSHALTPDPYNERKGWTSAGKARVPLMILALLDVLRAYPGQIPDVDAVLSVADFPCVPLHEEGRTKPPAIMMSYGAKPGMASVLVPDHTHWGNEGGLLARLSDGRGISGWDAQYQYLKIASQERFLDKRNYAYWVGRVQFTEEGERDRQRYVLTECGRRLREIGDPRAGYISINSGGNYPITEYCRHRYLPYLESMSYSSKYKQLLACGSVMVAPTIEYPDFFLRALQKGIHYVELDPDDLCEDIVSKIKEMDDVVWSDASTDLNLTSILEPILNERRNSSKTLRGPRFLDALEHGASIPNEPPADAENKRHKGQYSWGSNLMPWEIAWNGQLWLEEHLTMTDVREGFRDVLVEYGKLMKYTPTPTKNAYCYDGPLALRQFGPDPNDAADILETYPWTLDYGMEACAPYTTGWEKWPGFYNQYKPEDDPNSASYVQPGTNSTAGSQGKRRSRRLQMLQWATGMSW